MFGLKFNIRINSLHIFENTRVIYLFLLGISCLVSGEYLKLLRASNKLILCQSFQKPVEKVPPLYQKVFLVFLLFLYEFYCQTMLRRQQRYRNTPKFLLQVFFEIQKVCITFFFFPFSLVIHTLTWKHDMCGLLEEADATKVLLVFRLLKSPLLNQIGSHIQILI